MVDNRTNYAKDIASLIRETYGEKIKVFDAEIPHSVRAAEIVKPHFISGDFRRLF